MTCHRTQQHHQHLRHAKAKNHLAQPQQLGQIELQADDKHQQHHTHFGHRGHRRLALFNQSPALTEKNTGQQITQNGRQMKQATADHADHSEQQVNQSGINGAHSRSMIGG